MTKRTLFILTFILTTVGCVEKEHDEQSFLHWIKNPENGLIISKTINGLELSVQYLPPEYLVLKEIKESNISSSEILRLLCEYERSISFLLTIKPLTGGQNIVYSNIRSIEHYKQRVLDLNFTFSEKIRLNSNIGRIKPAIAIMENTYNLQDHKSFYILFTDEQEGKRLQDVDEYDFIFYDDIFKTGVSHFKFQKEDFDKIPCIKVGDLILD